ncbi:MAG: 5-formyltetrahydrofolate cyclo-ligase [Candidatus Diapherotrites archaeon]|nr:5-formyltetrahydrofolate cyclo-ligase [Candidatus Diapherotrites archaeon]
MKSISELKQKLRNEFIEKRKSIPAKKRKQKSKLIAEKLFSLPEFLNAKKIMVYHSFKEEVETDLIIQKAHETGKEVFVPDIHDAENCLMNCVKIEKETELEMDCFGICKPKKQELIHPKELDLVIVPGIAFDLNGNRLGWGKGYFDRFLKKCKKCIFIGLAFEEQITEKIPADEMDVKINIIITEKQAKYT